MKGNEIRFNIHDIFRFKIICHDATNLKDFAKEFSYFRTEEKIESELDVIISDLQAPDYDCRIVDNKYYVKKNYLFCNDNHKVVNWRLCIKDMENKPKIYFNGTLFSDFFLRDYIVEPMIGAKLAQRGYSLLHASSIVINRKGFIFAGYPGVGKTSIVLNLAESNSSFLSDELTILSANGMIYSFPLPLHLYNYNLNTNFSLRLKISTSDICKIKLKYLIYLLSLKNIKFPHCIAAGKIFNKIERKFPLHSLVILSKTNKKSVNLIEDIDKDDFVKHLISINRHQFKRFSEYLSAYSFCNSKGEMSSYWQMIEKNLFDGLRNIQCNEIEIPSMYNYNFSEEFNNILNKMGGL